MNVITKELEKLHEDNPDIALVLDVFREIETVYQETLEVMGYTKKPSYEVGNSATVTISFNPTEALSNQ